jgi:hypothetical protein
MTDDEDTLPLTVPPGRRLDDQTAAALIESFRDRYRRRKLHDHWFNSVEVIRANVQPTWLAFDNRHRVTRAQLPRLAIADDLPVLLYLEYADPPEVYASVWREAGHFLLTRHPWERQSEAYVFPPGMEWVVAYTHEYESDFEDLILLSGRIGDILEKHA